MNPERYKPTNEDFAKAEESMSDQQQELSVAREDGYNLGRLHERFDTEDEKKKLRWSTEVNGVKVSVGWIKGVDENSFSGYEIFFPQLNEEMDAVIAVSSDPIIAKEAYDYACKAAQVESDPAKVYQMVVAHLDKLEAGTK